MAVSTLELSATHPSTTPVDSTIDPHLAAGRYREAAVLLFERYRRRRDRGDAERLAAVLALAGDFERAAEVLLTLLDYQPTSAELHERLGDVYVRWGRLDDAAAARRAATIFNRAKQVVAQARQPNGWAGRC